MILSNPNDSIMYPVFQTFLSVSCQFHHCLQNHTVYTDSSYLLMVLSNPNNCGIPVYLRLSYKVNPLTFTVVQKNHIGYTDSSYLLSFCQILIIVVCISDLLVKCIRSLNHIVHNDSLDKLILSS